MKEGNISQLIIEHACKVARGCRVFKNPRGLLYTKTGTPVNVGLGPNGSADLIGWVPVVVTQDMVGQKFAMFLSIEVKKPKKYGRENQIDWIELVRGFGGRAGLARNNEDAAAIIRGEIRD